MEMTQEKAIKRLKTLKARCERLVVSSDRGPEEWRKDAEAIDVALSGLRPVSREQLEKVWRGEWEVDEFGHKCSKCGEYLPSGDDDIFPQFCPNCGDAKTDEAVEMVMERFWQSFS